ncbi:ead/Ea22-like family protein [Citrobacter freundii]|nr:ead/Ea22-like family protein [Citrobacter freundii]
MTAHNKQALRQKAEKAGVEEWQSRKMPGSGGEYTVIVKGSLEKHPGWSTCRPVADEIVDKKTMDFIAEANPATVLALLDDLEDKDKAWSAQDNHINQQADRIESLEKKNGELGRAIGAAEKRIAELSHHLQCAHAFIEHTEAFGHEASNGILCCGDAQWNIDESKSALAAAGKGE